MFRRKTSSVDPNEATVRATAELWREGEAKGIPEEKLVEIVLAAIDESIPRFVGRLLHDMPRMLRHRQKFARGFERRLQKRWGSPFTVDARQFAQESRTFRLVSEVKR